MTVREYIGARYVPLFMGEWDNTNTYEPLSIVTNQGNSYTSRQFVPVGVALTDEVYWAETGNFNGQVEQYRQEVLGYVENVEDLSKVTAHSFETVAAMKEYDGFQAGDIAHTNGFHSSGDGGAAWYTISATGTANKMDVIAAGELFANLVITEPFVTPEMFGAYGNGEHDDTVNINRCFELASANSLYACLRNKTYIFNVPDNTYFGYNGLFISGNGAVLSSIEDRETEFSIWLSGKFNIDDITIESNGKNNNWKIHDSQNSKMTNCVFVANGNKDNKMVDFYTNNSDLLISNCSFIKSNATTATGGTWVREQDNEKTTKNITFENCLFSHSGVDEVISVWDWYGKVENIRFENCTIIENSTNSRWVLSLGANNTSFNNCVIGRYEKCDKAFILSNGTGGEKNTNTLFSNCLITHSGSDRFNSDDSTYEDKIKFTGCVINIPYSNVQAFNCVMQNCAVKGMFVYTHGMEFYDSIIETPLFTDYTPTASSLHRDGALVIDNCVIRNLGSYVYRISQTFNSNIDVTVKNSELFLQNVAFTITEMTDKAINLVLLNSIFHCAFGYMNGATSGAIANNICRDTIISDYFNQTVVNTNNVQVSTLI